MIQISFFKRYIYYPQKWMHNLSVSNKIFITSLCFCLLPLTSNLKLLIEVVLLLVVYYYIYDGFQFFNIKLLKPMICYFVILLISMITDRSSLLYTYIHIDVKLNLTSFVHIFFSGYKNIDLNNIYILSFVCPSLSIRSFLAILMYFLLHYLLEHSTRYESILLYNSSSKSIIGMSTKCLEEIQFIIILSYYFIQSNEKALTNTVAFTYIKGVKFTSLYVNKKIILITILLYLRVVKNFYNRLLYGRIVFSKELNLFFKEKWLLR